MKKIFLLVAFAGICYTVSAQSEITTVTYLKVEREAVANEIPFPEKTIMKAIDARMEQEGYKGKDTKGFTVYGSVKLLALGNGEYDLYFMAERKSRRNRDNSTLTLMISTGAENFVTEKNNVALMKNAKKYLENIVDMIAAYDLETRINDQQEEIDKAIKKFSNLVEDGQSLEKKRISVEKDIEDNKKDQAKQLDSIEKQKQLLETLKAARKQ